MEADSVQNGSKLSRKFARFVGQPQDPSMLRRMLFLFALVGCVWACASIEVRGKTPVGHALVWWKAHDFFAEKRDKPMKKRDPARPMQMPEAPRVEKEATAKRVALLERAAKAIERDDGNPGAKTSLGEKTTTSEKKALDELVSSRVPRRR